MAAITRTSTFRVPSAPTRSYSPSCSTRSSFGCSSTGRSPISSRKIVPPSAISKRPRRSRTAPVKAPRACPKNSLSKISRGMALQLTFTNGRLDRRLRLWTSCASSSLPVPDSPVMSTVASVRATSSTCCMTCRSARLPPTIRPDGMSRSISAARQGASSRGGGFRTSSQALMIVLDVPTDPPGRLASDRPRPAPGFLRTRRLSTGSPGGETPDGVVGGLNGDGGSPGRGARQPRKGDGTTWVDRGRRCVSTRTAGHRWTTRPGRRARGRRRSSRGERWPGDPRCG